MNTEDLKRQLKRIMAEAFRVDESTITEDSSTQNHVAWESLNHINLILGLEENFKIKLSDSEVMETLSFRSLVDVIASKLDKGEGRRP